MLEIKTFGGLSIYKDSVLIQDLGSRKAEAILVYLAAGGRSFSRLTLATLFWPDSAEDNALSSLRVALSSLRKVFRQQLDISRQSVGLQPGVPIKLDLLDLEENLTANQVEEALALYRGEFLQGFFVHNSQDFEAWRREQDLHARGLLVNALHNALDNSIRIADYQHGLVLSEHLLRLDPIDELAHRQTMLLFTLHRKRGAALAQYERCREILHRELGIEPSQETQTLYTQISQGAHLSELTPAHHRFLPTPHTSFIGREQETSQLSALLRDTNCRILTLLGPGGVGKTRLAIQVANKISMHFPDGTCFVPLELVPSQDYIIPSISSALQFNVDTLATQLEHKEQLFDFLQNKSLLMILDGFDHLVPSALQLSELVARAPRVKLLITSRQKLALEGEWIFPVMGLPLTQADSDPPNTVSSALQLFIERARQANTTFHLKQGDQQHAFRICQLVDGLPLAIELAASWTSLLPIMEICEQIQNNLSFLSTTARDIPEKHHSMRAVFDTSWSQLPGEQQDAFSKLSIFPGRFGWQAAEAVVGVSLQQLADLKEKSLLASDPDGRFYLHALLRQYAYGKLSELSSVPAKYSQQHARYYLDFLTQRQVKLTGPEMICARSEIQREMENILFATQWATLNWQATDARQVLTAMLAFYVVYGWHEGRDTFQILARARKDSLQDSNSSNPIQDPLYLIACAHQAFLQTNLGQITESETISRACLQPLRALALEAELSECLHNLGVNASFRGEYEQARLHLEEAVLLGRRCQHIIWPTYLLWLGHVYFLLGDYESGMQSFEKCYDIYSSAGNRWGLGFAISKMGLAAAGLAQYQLALQYFEQALGIFEENGDQAGKAYSLSRMSMSAFFIENYSHAIQFGQEGLQIFQLLNHRWGICTSLCQIGFSYLGSGKKNKAKVYFLQALSESRKNQMTPLILYALVGLASMLIQDGEEELGLEIYQYVKQNPGTPVLYLKQADIWFAQIGPIAPEQGESQKLINLEVNDLADYILNSLTAAE